MSSFKFHWGIYSLSLKVRLKRLSKKENTQRSNVTTTPEDNDSGSYEINLLDYGGRSLEQWLVQKDKLLKALDGQGISIGSLRYTFTERLLKDDAKATFNHTAMDKGKYLIDNFNKVIAKMIKQAFTHMLSANKRCIYVVT